LFGWRKLLYPTYNSFRAGPDSLAALAATCSADLQLTAFGSQDSGKLARANRPASNLASRHVLLGPTARELFSEILTAA